MRSLYRRGRLGDDFLDTIAESSPKVHDHLDADR
jgi:hypothetical protein